MPALSSRAISAFNATARRYFIWKSPWDISIAASSGRYRRTESHDRSITSKPLRATRPIGHTIAYCRAVEALSQTHVSARAQVIRGIALELERIANHIGDLGALAGDVGYLPTMSYCGRIRGDVLNMTAHAVRKSFRPQPDSARRRGVRSRFAR